MDDHLQFTLTFRKDFDCNSTQTFLKMFEPLLKSRVEIYFDRFLDEKSKNVDLSYFLYSTKGQNYLRDLNRTDEGKWMNLFLTLGQVLDTVSYLKVRLG